MSKYISLEQQQQQLESTPVSLLSNNSLGFLTANSEYLLYSIGSNKLRVLNISNAKTLVFNFTNLFAASISNSHLCVNDGNLLCLFNLSSTLLLHSFPTDCLLIYSHYIYFVLAESNKITILNQTDYSTSSFNINYRTISISYLNNTLVAASIDHIYIYKDNLLVVDFNCSQNIIQVQLTNTQLIVLFSNSTLQVFDSSSFTLLSSLVFGLGRQNLGRFIDVIGFSWLQEENLVVVGFTGISSCLVFDLVRIFSFNEFQNMLITEVSKYKHI